MTTLPTAALDTLQQVVSLPTAPFREELVQAYVLDFVATHGLAARSDRFGNILVTYRPPGVDAAEADALPRVCFTAHMDHPGFEVVAFDPATRVGVAEFRGGTSRDLWPGCGLRIHIAGTTHLGTATSELPEKKSKTDFQRFDFEVPKPTSPAGTPDVAAGAIGWFDVPSFSHEGDRIHTKSADDLAQAGLLLALLAELTRERPRGVVECLFTRAEEVGFVGASGLLETDLLPPEGVPIVVLECSKALPGVAEIGNGPVLRVGDAGTLYDPDVDAWMLRAARALKGETPDETAPPFAFQRALMTGGVCEAGLLTLTRGRVGALALPLGNYHNIPETGDRSAPLAEIISESDCAHQLRLMLRLAVTPFETQREGDLLPRLLGYHKALAPHLLAGPAATPYLTRADEPPPAEPGSEAS